VGILGVFAALAGIAIVATAFRQPSHHVTVTKQFKKSQEVAPKPTDTKPDAPKPTD
jgi:hypothetical protein